VAVTWDWYLQNQDHENLAGFLLNQTGVGLNQTGIDFPEQFYTITTWAIAGAGVVLILTLGLAAGSASSSQDLGFGGGGSCFDTDARADA